MALKGKDVKIQASTDGTTWTDVLGLDNASMGLGGENIDITEFQDAWTKRLQGIKDNTFTLSGNYLPSDPGQQMIRDALINDTALYIQFLPDGTAGFNQEVKVASFEPSAQVRGRVEVNIQCEGTGPVTVV